MIDILLERLTEASVTGPLLGFAVGVLLGLSPLALPSVPAVVGILSPGRISAGGERLRLPLLRVFPSILAFTLGMDGVVAFVGYVFISVTIALVRASIVLHLVAAAVMGILGIRLLLRRTSLCRRAETIPPKTLAAFGYGILFSIGGCPGCAPISLGIGSAAALIAGPLFALVVIAAFVLGHAAVLTAAAAVGGRLLPDRTNQVSWLRLDMIVGAMFVLAAIYYLYRVLAGEVTTKLPGEPGSGILP